jgi:hypothetical protein
MTQSAKKIYRNQEQADDYLDRIDTLNNRIQGIQSGGGIFYGARCFTKPLLTRTNLDFNGDIRMFVVRGLQSLVETYERLLQSMEIPVFTKNEPFGPSEIALIGSAKYDGKSYGQIAKLVNKSQFYGQKVRTAKALEAEMKRRLKETKDIIKKTKARMELNR